MISKKAILVLFLILIVNILPLNAITQTGDDFPNLNKIYQTESKKTNFVIAIDRSGSMNNLWPEVKSQLIDFINALPDGDYVSIIGFGNKADNLLIPRTLTRESKQNLQSEIEGLTVPREQNTDLFAGIDKILEEINRPDSNPLSFVFIFTDFENDPPSNAIKNYPLAKRLPDLNEKYKNYIIKTNKLVRVYALQLPLSTKAGSDYDKVSKIFEDNVQRVYLNKNVMHEWFQRLRRTVQREKTNLLVQSDISRAVQVTGIRTNRNGQFIISIQNKSMLPLILTGAILDTEKYGRFQVSLNEQINPGKEQNCNISYAEKINIKNTLIQKKVPIKLQAVEVNVKLPYQSELAMLNIDSKMHYRIPYDKSVFINIGIFPYWQIALGLLIIILLAYFFWKNWLKPASPISNSFRKIHLYGSDFHEEIAINMNKCEEIVGNTIGSTVKSTLESIPFEFVIQSKKPFFPLWQPKRGIYVYANQGPLSYKGKVYDVEEKHFVESDIPLPTTVKQALPVNYRASLSLYRDGERIDIKFSRN